jgi:hypothetical protein
VAARRGRLLHIFKRTPEETFGPEVNETYMSIERFRAAAPGVLASGDPLVVNG